MTNCLTVITADVTMRKAAIILAMLLQSVPAWACFQCRQAVEAEVYGQNFASNLFLLLLPLAVLFALGVAVYFSDAIHSKLNSRKQDEQ